MIKLRKGLAVLVAFALVFSAMIQGAFAAPENAGFSDVTGHWAEDQILEWSGKGIIVGNNGMFWPDSGITRAAFCSIINRAFGFSEKSGSNFSDVKPEKWYSNDVAIGKEAGYVLGYGNNLFGPEDKITRQDAARVLQNIFKFEASEWQSKAPFVDDDQIASYAREAVAIFSSKGYILGDNNHFYPKNSITRAEFVAIMDRAVDQLYVAAGTYNDKLAVSNVVVKTGDVILKNMIIEGNLYLAEGIGQGNVTLENVTVKGKTFVNGGGENSIILQNTTLGSLVVEKKDGKIRIVAKDGTVVAYAELHSGARLVEEGAGSGFKNVEVQEILPGQQVILDGDFELVNIEAPGVAMQVTDGTVGTFTIGSHASGSSIQIAQGATVGTLTANAPVSVSGKGQITHAQINAAGVVLEQRPAKVTLSAGVTASVGGQTINQSYNTSGGSGSSGGNNPPVQGDWTLVWNDEFNGTAVDTGKWHFENKGDGFGNNEQQYYRTENTEIKDGKLVINAKKEEFEDKPYTSAKLYSKAAWKYGRFEASIKLPIGQGFWPAFWMMPKYDNYLNGGSVGSIADYGGWAASGEIDIMEAKGRFPSNASGALHYGGISPNNVFTGKEYTFPVGQTINQFHTYALEWEPGEIRWYIDGILYQTQNNWYTKGDDGEEKYAFPAPFDKEFYLMLNLAIGGNFDGNVVPEDSMFPAQMEVDYVRVYELTGRPYKTPAEPNIPKEPLPEGARQPDSTGNLVKDINFEQGIKDNREGVDAEFGEVWNFIYNEQFGGVATASVENIEGENFAKIDVTNSGKEPYSVQLEQHTTLGKGRWYRFSFDAKADKSRTLSTKLGGGPTRDWAAYSEAYMPNLTTDMKHFSYEFQMTKDTDILTRIEFNCATVTGPVWIGNVRVEEIEPPVIDYNAAKEPLLTGNHIYNGTFDKYTIDRMAYWNVKKSGASAEVKVPENTRELTAKITDGGSEAGAITVDQKGLQLIKDSEYKISFKARADADRTIKAKLVSKDGSVVYIPEHDVPLKAGMQKYTRSFKMEVDTDREAQLIFMLGGNNEDVYIDDVSLTTDVIIDPNIDLIEDGTFDDTTEIGYDDAAATTWKHWQPQVGQLADIKVVNKAVEADVKNVGGGWWAIQLYQLGVKVFPGTYKVKFDMSSTIERLVYVELAASGAPIQKITVGSEMKTYEAILQVTKAGTHKFLFGFGKEGNDPVPNEPHKITIDNVSIKALTSLKQPPILKADPAEKVAGKDDVVITFTDDEAWRNAIKAVKVEGSALDANKYTVMAGMLKIDKSCFTLGKSYTILVESEDYLPSEVKQTIKSNGDEPQGVDIITDGHFDSDTGTWKSWWGDEWSGVSTGDAIIADGKLKIDIASIGTASYSPQVFRENLTLVNGQTYEMKFKAQSSVARKMNVNIGNPLTTDPWFVNYAATEVIDLTTDMTTYSFSFTVGEDTCDTIKIVFEVGNVTDGNAAPVVIYLDDVTLTPVVKQEPGVDLVGDGGFDSDTGTWKSWWGDQWSGVSTGSASIADGKLKIDIGSIGGVSYSPQVFRENLTLVKGRTYDVSFKAQSSVARKMNVNIGKPLTTDPWFVNYASTQVIDLTTELVTYSFSFTVSEDTCDTIKIVFEVGNVTGGNAAPVVIYLDDVTIMPRA